MTDELKYEELNGSIESLISRGEAASTGDEDVDALARLASGLRGLPNPEFKARLRAELVPERSWRTWWPITLITRMKSLPPFAWLIRQRAVAGAGGGCGLAAGACCISGAVAHVTGLATAAAVTAYIHSTLPYFVGLSIVMLLACLAWSLRPQGFTPRTVALTVRRHGFAFAGAYGAVFGASMALTMAMGLY
jgi:hypothetical protein